MGKRLEEYLGKYRFIKALEEVLLLEERSNITKIDYSLDKKYNEVITIEYRGGGVHSIPATGNSNGANMIVIAEAVYGQ